MRVTPASRAACTTASASAGEGRCSLVDRGMAPRPTALTVRSPMRRCCMGPSCPAGSVATVSSLFDVPDQERPAVDPDAPLAVRMRPQSLDEVVGQQHLLGPRAPPPRPPPPPPPGGGGGGADVAGPLRPARHREDDAGARHLAGHPALLRPA